jgi:amino acid transporter
MQIIFAAICVIIFFVVTVSLGSVNLGAWLKAAVVVPLVLLVVYSLARIQPKEGKHGNETKE